MRQKLEQCLSLTRKIKDKEEEIADLRAKTMSPKIQTITDMPKGGSVGNVIEQYIIRLERLQNKKGALEERRNKLWGAIELKLIECELNDEISKMLYLRFYNAYAWGRCAELLGWNANKCFRMYRKALTKVHKNT